MHTATETNFGLRPVRRNDLVAGTRVLLIEDVRQIDPTIDPRQQGIVIELQKQPIQSVQTGERTREMLGFVMGQADALIQCLVPLTEVIYNKIRIRSQMTNIPTRYWVPIRGVL